MKKRRLKKSVYIFFALIIVFTIASIGCFKYIKYINSYEYKLEKIGYNEKEQEILLKLEDKEIDNLLTHKYDKNIAKFAKQKYFLYKNLDHYLEYYKENKSEKFSHIISIVNVNANYEWYDEDAIKKTDTSLKELMLVNKFYHLEKKYIPNDITDIKNTYAYDDNSTTKEVLDAFIDMWRAAKDEDLSLIVTSSYRSYLDQETIWESYANRNGEKWADSFAARPGYSEHQTGLALDIVTYNSTMDNFDDSLESKWLKKNAYKYGFILRYPKGKENITGYDYEPWHYRYVGTEVAKKIHKLNITFDEYYAYYIEK